MATFQKQYEAYLLRVYGRRRPPGSITGDSGIVSQNEDRCSRKTVATAQPADLASAEATRVAVSSPRARQAPLRSSQPRSISKFHDRNLIDDTNNPVILPTTAPLDVFPGHVYDESVLHGPYVHVARQSSEQLAQQMPAGVILAPDARQYARASSVYDETAASRTPRDVSNLLIQSTTAPILQVTSTDRTRADAAAAAPVNRFFGQRELRAPVGRSAIAAQFSADDAARYEGATLLDEAPRHSPRQFDPSILAQSSFQYHDANVVPLADPRMTRYTVERPAIAKSSAYSASMDPAMNVVDQIGPLPGYVDYILRSPQKSEDEGSIRSLTSDDVDDLIRRNERLLWRNAAENGIARTLAAPGASNEDPEPENDGRVTAILEDELDRYISNIRRLHREHGVPTLQGSQEEPDHEQNTSGDLLNVTLSEDAAELPVEDRALRERVPEEMNRILALASDLACGTVEPWEVTRPADRNDDRLFADEMAKVEGNVIIDRAARSDVSELVRKSDNLLADEAGARGTTTSATRNAIKEEDVAPRSTKLEQPNNAGESHDRDATSAKRDNAMTGPMTNVSLNKLGSGSGDRRDESKEKLTLDAVTRVGEESDIEGLFDIAKELAPWDLAGVRRSVRELRLDDEPDDVRAAEGTVDGTTDGGIGEEVAKSESPSRDITLPPSQAAATRESDHDERNEPPAPVCAEEEADESPGISNEDRREEHKSDLPADETPVSRTDEQLGEPDEGDSSAEERKDVGDEASAMRVDERVASAEGEYSVERGYDVEDPSQARRYDEQQRDPSEQYQYGQGETYERAGTVLEEYERYADQGYAQEGQGYVEYVDSGGATYGQYVEDPEQQRYQDDPNAGYGQHHPGDQPYPQNLDAQYAEQQDPNQAYGYDYDQRYDPTQGYEGDQAYAEYAQNVPYDPDQTYDPNQYIEQQEYGGEEQQQQQQNPNEYGVVVGVESSGETGPEAEEEALQERETDGDEDRMSPQRQAADNVVDDTSRSRKRKDVIKSLLDSDTTDTTIERNASNTESDFDFN